MTTCDNCKIKVPEMNTFMINREFAKGQSLTSEQRDGLNILFHGNAYRNLKNLDCAWVCGGCYIDLMSFSPSVNKKLMTVAR